MRILFLQQQPCCRALKYAAALRSSGVPGLALGFCFRGRSLSELYGTGDELFDRWWRLDGDPGAGLSAALAEFRPDVIHSHNLPDTLTVLALELGNGAIPVVHDVHDLQSLRRTPYEDGFPEPDEPLALERRAVQDCSALVTVSEELLAEIQSRHRLPVRTLVFPNFALRRDVPAAVSASSSSAGPPRLVYQGTLSTNGGHYDLRDLFAAIAAQGIELHVYPARRADAYDRIDGVRLHETLTPPELLRELPRYDLGWAGFNSGLNAPHLDTALPNKLFEYLSCGLPVLTLSHRALSRFLDETGLGISLRTVADLRGTLETLDFEALRARVAAVRHEFTFEARIDDLVALYEDVVG
jgi:glycosyltransferase involved in cell wall biosynthesis